MKRFIPFLMLLALCCKEKLPGVPSNVIPMAKMEKILIDMHIADAVAGNRAMGDIVEKKFTREYYDRIFKNHKVGREEFLKSYNFYENNPALLNIMYDEILSEMSKMEAGLSRDTIGGTVPLHPPGK